MSSVGYSGTPLAKKLGYKNDFKVTLIGEPDNYLNLLEDLPSDVVFSNDITSTRDADIIHFFTTELSELTKLISNLKSAIKQNGSIWVSWPKKASKVPTDISENDIRELALKHGLVDIKVCAVDHIWSGLKLVIPVKDREG